MRYIIYLIIVAVMIYMSRNYIRGWVMEFKAKRQKLPEIKKDLIYVPIRSSRTFTFTIEIAEIGDGTANISVVKR